MSEAIEQAGGTPRDAPRGAAAVTQPTHAPRIDACVYPVVEHANDLKAYMPQPWRSQGIPGPEDYDYIGTGPLYSDAGPAGALIGSDQGRLVTRTCVENGASHVILVPRTRGLLPDLDLSAAVCAATNRWLAEQWLAGPYADRFAGSIRIDPRDPAQAVAEIERWADHPRMVQVAVTTQAQAPYGHRQYYPVWAALDETGLPLVVNVDGGSGIHYPLTVAGSPKYQIEKEVLYPSNFSFHFASMLAEGVFERFPRLRVVFADGGHDFLTPIMWRLHKDWRGNRPDIPWLRRSPFEYLRSNIRFVTNLFAGTPDREAWDFWMELADVGTLLMYGSKYPRWDYVSPQDATAGLRPDWTAAVLGGNAASFYGLA